MVYINVQIISRFNSKKSCPPEAGQRFESSRVRQIQKNQPRAGFFVSAVFSGWATLFDKIVESNFERAWQLFKTSQYYVSLVLLIDGLLFAVAQEKDFV